MLILVLWFAATILIIPQIAPYANGLGFWKQVLICILIICGAPFMFITQAIELLLDMLMPEGWDDDDKY